MQQRVAFIAILIACMLAVVSCITPKTIVNNAKYVSNVVATDNTVKSALLPYGDGQLHYKYRLGCGNAVLVFIHGTPGDWQALGSYLVDPTVTQLAAIAVSIDRPGWGLSALPQKTTGVLSLKDQSLALTTLLKQLKTEYPEQPIYLIGHSLGASLSARMLIDHQAEITGALLLAGGIDPALTGPRWYNGLANTWLAKQIIGNKLNKSNAEMAMLRPDLDAMQPSWPALTSTITVIQGEQDKLVDPANSTFFERHFINAALKIINLPNQGHFLPWQRRPEVLAELTSLVKHSASTANENAACPY